MRIVYFGNNWVGWQVLRYLKERDEEIVGLVAHPSSKARCGEEIRRAADLPPTQIFDGASLRCQPVIDAIRALDADLGLSVFFGYILRSEILEIFPRGCINLHPALLPYNRGAHPNIWSIVDGTPAGASLHYMDAGIDTGDIIAQSVVEVEPIDTGATLYRRLELASLELFKRSWPAIRAGTPPRMSQRQTAGTYHRGHDVDRIDEIDPEATYKAKDLIDRIRARTFPPYCGAYMRHHGRKVYLRLQLEYGDEEPEN